MADAMGSAGCAGRKGALVAFAAWATAAIAVGVAVNVRYASSGIIPLSVAYAALAWVAVSGLITAAWMLCRRA